MDAATLLRDVPGPAIRAPVRVACRAAVRRGRLANGGGKSAGLAGYRVGLLLWRSLLLLLLLLLRRGGRGGRAVCRLDGSQAEGGQAGPTSREPVACPGGIRRRDARRRRAAGTAVGTPCCNRRREKGGCLTDDSRSM
jgi:hypothetical protein